MKKWMLVIFALLFLASAASARQHGELRRIIGSLWFHNEWSEEAQPNWMNSFNW